MDFLKNFAQYRKAIAAALIPGLSLLGGFLIGGVAFGDLSAGQWVAVAIATLGTPAAVYGVRNGP